MTRSLVGKTEYTDEELIASFIQGEDKAFDGLFLRYEKPLHRFVERHLKESSEAADVVQDVFLKVFRALPEFRQEASFKNWLFHIAMNTSRDYLSDQLSNPLKFFSEEEWDVLLDQENSLTAEADPYYHLHLKELETSVFNKIQHLPEELRTSIIYREFMDLSYEDIAEIMDCPLGTVRSRLSRAREIVMPRMI